MFILGLTGSIGMGKSTTAGFFADAGVPVHDADAAVHALYRQEAVPLVEAAFPGTTGCGGVDRRILAERVLGDPGALKHLESIVHPLVRAREQRFLAGVAKAGARLVVLDVPLLFEVGGERRVDATVVVTASADVQRARVLARADMTAEKFASILAKQMPDAQKRGRAHFLVDTGHGLDSARYQVHGILRALAAVQRPARSV